MAEPMPTYTLLAVGLVLVSLVIRGAAEVLLRRRGRRIPLRPTILTAVALFVLTAVFDNLMIAIGLYSYAPEHLLGLHLGLAPIEDFSYPLATALVLPAVWAISSVAPRIERSAVSGIGGRRA